jgi:hypothetical protein
MSSITSKSVLCLLPRKCDISGKRLWFTRCIRVTREISGPGYPVYLHYWFDNCQFLVLELKGTLDSEIRNRLSD